MHLRYLSQLLDIFSLIIHLDEVNDKIQTALSNNTDDDDVKNFINDAGSNATSLRNNKQRTIDTRRSPSQYAQ